MDMTQARAGAETGMKRAAEHANSCVSGWTDDAYAYLTGWARGMRGGSGRNAFMAEDVRASAERFGFSPPDNRAWGPVFRRAVSAGLIRKAGYAPSKTGHCRPMPLWEAV